MTTTVSEPVDLHRRGEDLLDQADRLAEQAEREPDPWRAAMLRWDADLLREQAAHTWAGIIVDGCGGAR